MVSESSPGIENSCYQSTITTKRDKPEDKAKNDTESIYEDMDRYSNIKPYMMETEVANYEICKTSKPHMADSFTVQAADNTGYEETLFT